MPRELIVSASGDILFLSMDSPALQSGEVRIQTLFTRIQHGLERLKIQGGSDSESMRSACGLTTWGVGKVIETSGDSNRFSVGDRVHGPMRHRERQTLKQNLIYPMPGTQPEFATLIGAGTLALACVHRCGIKYGDRVAVFGMGALGLLALQYQLMSGAREIVAVDPLVSRLKVAQNLGAHTMIQAEISQNGGTMIPVESITGLDSAIDFSNGSALEEAVKTIRPGGVLVAGAVTYPLQRINSILQHCEKHGIEFDCVAGEEPVERLVNTVEYSLANKHIIPWPIITNVIPFNEASRAFRQILHDPFQTIQILLSYDPE